MSQAHALAQLVQVNRRVRVHDYHLAEIERRLNNAQRVGTIEEVDPKKALVRVKIATDPDGKPVLTPWMPWSERAGGIKSWSPPTKGEQVRVLSPSGEVHQGWVELGGFSDQNKQPSEDGNEHKLVVHDKCSVSMLDGKMVFKADRIVLLAPDIDLGAEGGPLVHRKGDIDSGGDFAVGSATRVRAV